MNDGPGAAAPSRIALVTGGARRIGRAIVEDLAANGFAVTIHCNESLDEAIDLAASITRAGGRAAVIEADLANLDAARHLPARAATAFGPPTLLVNCAATFEADALGALDIDRFEHQMRVDLHAPVFITDAFAMLLPEEQRGLVVNIIDQRVWKTTPQFLSYQLAKSGLLAATRVMAQALAPRIRVNGIGPGPTVRSLRQTEEDFALQAASVPLGHGPALAEFGRTIRYLFETPSVTGQMIALDGGQHLAWQTADVMGPSE